MGKQSDSEHQHKRLARLSPSYSILYQYEMLNSGKGGLLYLCEDCVVFTDQA